MLLDLLRRTAAAVDHALGDLDDWGLAGTRAGQHHSDLAADAAALAVLGEAGVGVLSEESGLHRVAPGEARDGIVVFVDPLDGSTNAARGIPWYATSLCAVDDSGPRAALVVDVPRDISYTALRGEGAWRDGAPIRVASTARLSDAVVGLSGFPPHHLGWRQFRALGAVALDLCAVACGVFDGYVDCSVDAHGPWDYAAGVLICREAGATVDDVARRPLYAVDHAIRRTPVAGANPALFDDLVAARRSWLGGESSTGDGAGPLP